MTTLLHVAVRGAVTGSAATVAMSAFMLAAQRLGMMGKLPPKEITEASLDAIGLRDHVDEPVVDLLTAGTHLGFGAAAGALFAVLHRWLDLPVHAVIQALLFATGVWTVSYMGWVPALGIMPPAHRDEPGRPESMVAAHWIYGAVLGVITEAWKVDRRRWS